MPTKQTVARKRLERDLAEARVDVCSRELAAAREDAALWATRWRRLVKLVEAAGYSVVIERGVQRLEERER